MMRLPGGGRRLTQAKGCLLAEGSGEVYCWSSKEDRGSSPRYNRRMQRYIVSFAGVIPKASDSTLLLRNLAVFRECCIGG